MGRGPHTHLPLCRIVEGHAVHASHAVPWCRGPGRIIAHSHPPPAAQSPPQRGAGTKSPTLPPVAAYRPCVRICSMKAADARAGLVQRQARKRGGRGRTNHGMPENSQRFLRNRATEERTHFIASRRRSGGGVATEPTQPTTNENQGAMQREETGKKKGERDGPPRTAEGRQGSADVGL